MARQIDSLKLLLDAYEERFEIEDSLQEDIEMYGDNDGSPAADNYTHEVTDSLLNLWYLQHQNNTLHEGEYNMDSVHFSSNVPDSVYIRRLKQINSYITVPFNETVRNYIILYSEKMPTKMRNMLGLSSYYMPIFEETLSNYDLPQELKYMAVIESALNPVAVSRAGAKGMWQFMYNSARQYGLTVNSFVDERFDPVKSADAAARYLKDAYNIFGDWNLAICSYNCGPGNVNKAIRRAGSREFWDIYEYLPRETRGYVPAFVGALYAFTYYKEHGLSPAPASLPSHVDTFQVHKMLHFQQVNEVINVPVETLRDLNPQYVHDIIPADGDYVLKLPYTYTAAFIDHEDSIYSHRASEIFNQSVMEKVKESKNEASSRIVYTVKSGDYLGRIASRYHVSVNQIKQWNNLRSTNLRVGQKLVIYPRGNAPAPSGSVSSASSSSSSKPSSGSTTYTVRNGDTLYDIAKKYPGVSAQDIMKFNGMKSSSIRVGQKIKIPQ